VKQKLYRKRIRAWSSGPC